LPLDLFPSLFQTNHSNTQGQKPPHPSKEEEEDSQFRSPSLVIVCTCLRVSETWKKNSHLFVFLRKKKFNSVQFLYTKMCRDRDMVSAG